MLQSGCNTRVIRVGGNTNISWESLFTVSCKSGCPDILLSFYLKSYMLYVVVLGWIWERNSKCVSDFKQIFGKVQPRHWHWFCKCLGRKHGPYMCLNAHAQVMAGQTSVENIEHTGKPISSTMPNILVKIQ